MSRRNDIWTPPGTRKEPWMLDVEPSPTKGYTTPDGRHFQDCVLTVSEEKADMMWTGYMCARCTEPFTESYPDRCGVCGFPVKELQRKLLERDFLGRDPTAVAGFPMERELEHLERTHHKPKGLMRVPKGI